MSVRVCMPTLGHNTRGNSGLGSPDEKHLKQNFFGLFGKSLLPIVFQHSRSFTAYYLNGETVWNVNQTNST